MLPVKTYAKQPFVHSLLLAGATIFISSLLIPQAHSLNESLLSVQPEQGSQELPPQEKKLQTSVKSGFRPVPANRLNSAKRSTDEKRNPFAVDSPFASNGSVGNVSSMVTDLNSLRLTGIIQEGSSLKALVEDGSEHASLTLGDSLSLGVLRGLGFRLSAISFEQGTILITNGREERQISVQR